MRSIIVTWLALTPLGTASATAPAPPPVINPVANEAPADPAGRAAALRLASYAAVVADHKVAQDATRKLVDETDNAALVEFAGKPNFTRVAALARFEAAKKQNS